MLESPVPAGWKIVDGDRLARDVVRQFDLDRDEIRWGFLGIEVSQDLQRGQRKSR